jgi:3-methylfumaryl-CoA hydratase
MSTVRSGAGPTGDWKPVESVETDVIMSRSLVALDDLLDGKGAGDEPGSIVPPLWHWLAFLPRARQADLGPDGHPRRGGFLPPVSLPRRMFVGSRVEILGEVRADARLVRRGRVVSVQEKQGRSGALVFVTARYELTSAEAGDHLRADAAPLLVEEQDVVYRDLADNADTGVAEPGRAGTVAKPGPDAQRWRWRWDMAIEPSLLFRFSALTYNAHRIHYDREWAMGAEGYPGLVVHGPLQAVALAELCRRFEPGAAVGRFSFRAIHPKFDDGPLLLRGEPVGDDTIELASFDHRGVQTMQATAVIVR